MSRPSRLTAPPPSEDRRPDGVRSKFLDPSPARQQIVARMRVRALLLGSSLAALLHSSPAVAEERPPTVAKPSIGAELAVSTGASFALAPAVYSGARLIGSSSGDLNASALPALLVALVVPPAIATGALAWERRREGAHARFFPAYFYALGAQALVLFGATFANTWVADGKDLLLLSAVSGAATGGGATLGAELSF